MKLSKYVFFLSAATFSNIAVASIIQDQSNGFTRQIDAFTQMGQSFTAVDERISHISFFLVDRDLIATESFEVSVELFEGAVFDGQSLGATTLTLAPRYFDFADFDFSFVSLIVGGVYSAQLISATNRPGVQINQHSFPSGAPYLGGDYTGGDHILNGSIHGIDDTRFKVIAAAPVPVPAAAWLFGTGLIILVGVTRH